MFNVHTEEVDHPSSEKDITVVMWNIGQLGKERQDSTIGMVVGNLQCKVSIFREKHQEWIEDGTTFGIYEDLWDQTTSILADFYIYFSFIACNL